MQYTDRAGHVRLVQHLEKDAMKHLIIGALVMYFGVYQTHFDENFICGALVFAAISWVCFALYNAASEDSYD